MRAHAAQMETKALEVGEEEKETRRDRGRRREHRERTKVGEVLEKETEMRNRTKQIVRTSINTVV